MLELVREARRRLLKSELISQGANAFTAALAAFIILLILGTQILEWYWLALIPLGAAIAGVYLALRGLPSPYRTAQLVDDRAELADTLSTALYFSDKTESVSPEILDWQRHRAEDAARRVDLPRIFPYSVPRSAYAVAALALVASSLFALRYGLSRSLDLKPGLARMIRDQFTPADKKEVADNRREKPRGKDDSDTSNDAASQDQDQQSQDQPNADDPSDQGGDSQSAEKNGDSKDQANKPNGDQDQQGQQGQDQQAGDRDEQQQESGEQGSANQGENKGDQKQQSDGKQNSNNAGESGSLLSKMKDFAENLLSKIKPQQQNNSNPSQQQSASQNSKQGQSQGQQQKGQPQNSKDGQQGQSDQADAQQAQNGEQRDGQESKGKGSGDKSQNNKQPGSGIGSEDGDKSIKRAEQLAAMGKITELVGKRSATVTGESTVEVQNTSQQLHTAYVERGNAEHTQAGAEIDRDEVPVALQSYVEQYFDQVRKQPATTPAPKKQQ